MRHRNVLEIDRTDPLAARLDDILAAARDLHATIGIDPGDIPGREPAAVQRIAAFVLEAAIDDPRPANQQITRREVVPWKFRAVLVLSKFR
jgi:hypothetical protein